MRGGSSGPPSPVIRNELRAAAARRKRSPSPTSRKAPRLDPRDALSPLGDSAARTAGALADLALLTGNTPELSEVTTAATNEMLALREKAWRDGVEHGKWIKETEFEQARSSMPNKLTSVQSQLMDLQLRYAVLEGKYEEAKQTIHRSSLRDISNLLDELI